MDFDGIRLLVERDRELFLEWVKKTNGLSLEELNEGYNEWLSHYDDMFKKYVDLWTGDTVKDAGLTGAKLLYFVYLSDFALQALRLYTRKLKEEYDSLKKSKVAKKTKTKKSRI